MGYGGIKAFGFCEGIVSEIESLWNFAKCFLGGLSDHTKWPVIGTHVPPYMENANVEFLSQSNNSADCVGSNERFKFVDDLTALEIINLLTVGLSSYHLKSQVPNDIPCHNQIIQPEKLKTQEYLDEINSWTIRNKMLIIFKVKPNLL